MMITYILPRLSLKGESELQTSDAFLFSTVSWHIWQDSIHGDEFTLLSSSTLEL